MKPTPSKYLICYLSAMLLFSLLYALAGEGQWGAALLFQLLLFWLLNEAWFQLFSWPSIFLLIKEQIRTKGKEEANLRPILKLIRYTSFVLLLLPPLLFAALYFTNLALANGLQDWLGLPLSHGLFASSYLSVTLLFVMAWRTNIAGFSLCEFFEEAHDTNDTISQAPRSSQLPPTPTNTHAPAAIEPRQSLRGAAHKRLVEDQLRHNEPLLLQTAPLPYSFNHVTQLSMIVGCGVALISAIFWAIVIKNGGKGLEPLIQFALLGMCSLISIIAIPLILAPLRWKNRLAKADFFLTPQRAIICEKGKLRSIEWSDAPQTQLTMHPGGCGSIMIIEQKGLMGKVNRKINDLLGDSRPLHRETDDKERLSGFVHIPQAQEVYALIESLSQALRQTHH